MGLQRVVVVAQGKGGVGKTTLAFVLATAIANRISGQSDYRVACVDADPNTTLDLALRKAAFPEIISMTSDAEALLPSLREAQSLADLVLIDLEGSANQAMLYAAGKSDLVIIPAQPSAFDVREARRTAGVVQQAADLVFQHLQDGLDGADALTVNAGRGRCLCLFVRLQRDKATRDVVMQLF